MEMYKIVRFTGGETKDGETRLPSENKDRVNAAKVCVSLLGVPKPAVEKEKPHKKDAKEIKAEAKPTAEEMSVIEARLVQ